jgi:hypothetical protein
MNATSLVNMMIETKQGAFSPKYNENTASTKNIPQNPYNRKRPLVFDRFFFVEDNLLIQALESAEQAWTRTKFGEKIEQRTNSSCTSSICSVVTKHNDAPTTTAMTKFPEAVDVMDHSVHEEILSSPGQSARDCGTYSCVAEEMGTSPLSLPDGLPSMTQMAAMPASRLIVKDDPKVRRLKNQILEIVTDLEKFVELLVEKKRIRCKRELFHRINALRDNNIVSHRFSTAMHVLREIRNAAAHPRLRFPPYLNVQQDVWEFKKLEAQFLASDQEHTI